MELDFSIELRTACSEGNVEAVKELLDKEAYVDDYFFHESSPLCVAIRSKNETIVKMLLESWCKDICVENVVYRDECYYCSCPLILNTAVKHGNVKICECLIEAGAKIDHENIEGETSIFFAVKFKKLDMVKLFIEKGINVNEVDREYKSPLHNAAAQYGSLELVKTLLDAGSDIDNYDCYDTTPFVYAVECNNGPVVEFFIEKGINVNERDRKGKIALHIAAQNGSLELVETLLDAGSDINYEDFHDETPFFYAVRYGNGPVVEFFIEKGINVNAHDYDEKIPLHYAAGSCHLEIVRILLEAGSEPDGEDYFGRTPFFCAASNDSTDFDARDNTAVLNLLLERGARMNIKDRFGYTPLLRAIKYACYKNVEYLLNAGAYINIKALEKGYFIPFHREVRGCIKYEKTKSILKKYVNKFLAANISIDASMVTRMFELDGIEDEPYEESCRIEVEKMKIKTFWGTSLFDVFTKTKNPTFADNLMLEKFIKSDNIKEEFPNYAVLLKSKFTEAKNRNNLLNNAISKVKLDLQETGVHLPNEIKRKILCYLNNEDLETLIKAF